METLLVCERECGEMSGRKASDFLTFVFTREMNQEVIDTLSGLSLAFMKKRNGGGLWNALGNGQFPCLTSINTR